MLVVLSPHLDDAVLSVASLLIAEPDATVITCFAGVPSPRTPPSAWDVRTRVTDPRAGALARRTEDLASLAALGAGRAVHLDLLEVSYRGQDEDAHAALAEALRQNVPSGSKVLAPLAIGQHPDHILVRDAALALRRPLNLEVSLYADQPYSFVQGWPTWVLPRHRRLARAARDRLRTPPDRLAAWTLPMAAVPDLAPARRLVLSRDASRRKRAAVSAHASQLETLGGLRAAVGCYEVVYGINHPTGAQP